MEGATRSDGLRVKCREMALPAQVHAGSGSSARDKEAEARTWAVRAGGVRPQAGGARPQTLGWL